MHTIHNFFLGTIDWKQKHCTTFRTSPSLSRLLVVSVWIMSINVILDHKNHIWSILIFIFFMIFSHMANFCCKIEPRSQSNVGQHTYDLDTFCNIITNINQNVVRIFWDFKNYRTGSMDKIVYLLKSMKKNPEF